LPLAVRIQFQDESRMRDDPHVSRLSGCDAHVSQRRDSSGGHRQGLTIFLTGLSGAGKSTIANVLLARFLETGDRSVRLLDGDEVRKHLSPDLGFSKEHRDLNVRRIGRIASETSQNGGVAICALIAPYDAARKEVRAMVEGAGGGFLLVHVATPLAVCEERDRKGLYARARAGVISQFTGISDPYEVPSDAEVVVDATDTTSEDGADLIQRHLNCEGYLQPMSSATDSLNRELVNRQHRRFHPSYPVGGRRGKTFPTAGDAFASNGWVYGPSEEDWAKAHWHAPLPRVHVS
jgi:adenylyl-sulfate kinase